MIADTMSNGINNNAYIGNFRVQQSDSSTSPQQMMNQMTDGFKPFYKKYEIFVDSFINLSYNFLLSNSNQQLGNNNYVSPV